MSVIIIDRESRLPSDDNNFFFLLHRLLHQMKWQQIEPMIKFQSMKDEVGRLGDETRGYETEIKYYTSLADTSDTSNKMAEKAYKDSMKYGKNLEKTLTLLQDKTSRLHDNQAVAQCKDAILHMREEVDKQDVLIARMGWYQDNIQRCQIQIQEPDIGTIPHRLGELQQAPLPGIPRQSQFRVPSPPITSTLDFPRKLKLPQIESAKVPTFRDELLCLNLGAHEKDNTYSLVPSPPLTPRVPKKSRSIFSRK